MIKKIGRYIKCKLKNYDNRIIMPYKVHQFFKNSIWREKLENLKNIHKGKRCFIIGNGPSLKAEDLDKLKGEYTFASNLIGKIFDKTDWRPTYYAIMDPKLVKENIGELLQYEKKQMFVAVYAENFKYIKPWIDNKDIIFCEMTHGVGEGKLPKFSSDVSQIMYGGHTITYSLLQIAVHMGFDEIYLLGVDNNFDINTNFKGIISENKEGHFYKTDRKYSGNVEAMTNAYISARNYADEHGIKIFNATRGGKLEIYDRVDFDEVIKNR